MWFRGQAPGWNSSLRPVYPGYIRNLPINFRKNIVYKGFYTIHSASQMGLVVQNLPASSGAATGKRLIPGLGSFPWRRKWQSTPLQYSCLENPIEWGARRAIVHGVAKSRTQLRTSTFIHFHTIHGFRHPLGVFEYPLWIRRNSCSLKSTRFKVQVLTLTVTNRKCRVKHRFSLSMKVYSLFKKKIILFWWGEGGWGRLTTQPQGLAMNHFFRRCLL